MIGLLRRHTKLIFWILILLIVPAFIFWGTSMRKQRASEQARRVFGKIEGKTIRFSDLHEAGRRETRMLDFFLRRIVLRGKYRGPYYDYWHSLRDVIVERYRYMEELGMVYRLATGQWLPLRMPQRQVTDKEVERYIDIMFPSESGGRDTAKYEDYRRRYGLAEKDFFEEVRNNDRVRMYVSIVLNSKNEALYLNQMWERLLLVRELPKWNIQVTNREVTAYIQALLDVPLDELKEEYGKYVKRAQTTEKKMREEIEENIKIQKLRTLITDSATVPVLEAREYFDFDNTKKKIAFTKISLEDVEEAFSISPEALAYYHKNRESLNDPKRVKVDYLVVETGSFYAKSTVTEEEVRKEFESDPDRYTNEEGEKKEFAEVEGEIRKELTEKWAQSQARTQAEMISNISSAAELQGVAEEYGLELLHSGFISVEDADVERVDKTEEFVRLALGTELGKVSSVIDVGNGFSVLSPTELYEPGPSTPGSAAERIAKKLAEEQVAGFVDNTDLKVRKKAQAKYILLPENYYDDEVEVTEEEIREEYERTKRFWGDSPPEFETRREELRKGLLRRKTRDKFRDEGAAGLKSSSMLDFERAAQRFLVPDEETGEMKPLEIRTTGFITRSEKIDDEFSDSMMARDFMDVMFETKVGTFCEPFRVYGKGLVVLTTLKKRPEDVISVTKLNEMLKKEKLTEEEKELLESADFDREEYEAFVRSLPEALNEGGVGVLDQELYESYRSFVDSPARFYQNPALTEKLLVPTKRKVSYICIEKEDIKDHLNKPFEFEIRDYYDDHHHKYTDSATETIRPYTEVKAEIDEILTKERQERLEKLGEDIERYYERNKEEFKREVDGKEIIPPLEEIRDEVEEKVRDILLAQLSLVRVRKIPVSRATQLEDVAKKEGLLLRESDYFSADPESRIDGFLTGSEEVFRYATFYVELGEVSTPIPTEKGYCILSPFAEKPQERFARKDFTEVPDIAWVRDKSADAVNNIALSVSTEINDKVSEGGLDFESAVKELGFVFEETDYFKITDESIPELEDYPRLRFRLPQLLDARDPLSAEATDIELLPDNSSLIYHLVDEIRPTDEEFLKEIHKYELRIRPRKRANTYEEWLHAVAKKAGIDPIDERKVDKLRQEEELKKRAAGEARTGRSR